MTPEQRAQHQRVWLWSYRVGLVLWPTLMVAVVAALAWWMTRP